MRPKTLLWLALASGLAGIAYEVLYARLLSTWLGDLFVVGAGVLATFLLGIGVGALWSRRLVGWLWLLELGVGAYAFLVALVVELVPFASLVRALPDWSSSPAGVLAVVVAALAVPSTLIGTSVPLFSHALAELDTKSRKSAFDVVYRQYNIGAAFCVLLLEIVLLSWLGLAGSLFALSIVNLGIGVALRLRLPFRVAARPLQEAARLPVVALVLVSMGSATLQLFALKLSSSLFGPYHENFAIILAVALASIAAAAEIDRRHKLVFESLLAWGAVILVLQLLLLFPIVRLWGSLDPWMYSPLRRLVGKLGFTTLLFAPGMIVFGATVPALVREHGRTVMGRALSYSSFGNAAGFLISASLLFSRLSFLALGLVVTGSLAVSAIIVGRARVAFALGFAGVLIVPLTLTWQESIWDFPYEQLKTSERLTLALASTQTTERVRRLDSQLSLVDTDKNHRWYVINGYTSLLIDASGRPNLYESLYGVTPAFYSARQDHALVLGVGTGITAGASALVYDRVTAVDVDPAVLAAVERFGAQNHGLTDNPRAELLLDDALRTLARPGPKYDAIINTVTSPLYFSSSKLYTREFFELAKSRLAPGGVYTAWLDARVTETGASLIFRSLLDVFARCDLVLLRSSYAQMICGEEPRAHEIANTGILEKELAAWDFGELSALVDAITFPKSEMQKLAAMGETNTMYRPRLERRMARVALLADARREFAVDALLRPDLGASSFGPPLDDEAMGSRCALLLQLHGQDLAGCHERLGAVLPTSYVAPAVRYLHRTGRGERALRLIAHLESTDRFELASELRRTLNFN